MLTWFWVLGNKGAKSLYVATAPSPYCHCSTVEYSNCESQE